MRASSRLPSTSSDRQKDMTQASSQAGASSGPTSSPSRPSDAGSPTAGAVGAMTLSGVLTVAGIILVFVFFAVGIISLQYCINAWDRDAWDREGQRQGAQSGRRRRRGPRPAGGTSTRARGVDPELLRSLPVTVYKGSEHKGQVECAVCLAELEDGEEARFLPRCGHGFHAGCVDTWLASHTTCPLCRLTVAKPDASPAPSLLALPPVPPEPANYAGAALPASVLLGVSDHGAVTAVTTDAPASPPTEVLVIEIPELAVPTPTRTPRDAAKSPGSARLRSMRRLWSFGRQGAGATSSSSCAGAGASANASEGVDLEKGVS